MGTPSERPAIPRVHDILAPAKLHLLSRRPSCAPFLEEGRWAEILSAWKAQSTLSLVRIADEMIASRLPGNSGAALLFLLSSEFGAELDPSPSKAIGSITLRRSHDTSAEFKAGMIRAGTRFVRQADSKANPPVSQTFYESTEPVFVGSSGLQSAASPAIGYTQTVTIPIQAQQTGTSANIPQKYYALSQSVSSPISLSDPLFDSTFVPIVADAAGGSDDLDTNEAARKLRRLATASFLGQPGATLRALEAGALSVPGVFHVAVKSNLDSSNALVWFADQSWAFSSRLRQAVINELTANWQAFGCQFSVGRLSNEQAQATLNVELKDKRFVAFQDEITVNIRQAVQSYFNDRDDWWAWNLNGLRAAIIRSDRRLRLVRALSVTNLENEPFVPVSELPTTTLSPITHLNLSDTNIILTITAP